MRSATPKLLHPLCGRPMIEWPVAAAREAGASKIVVVDGPERPLGSTLDGEVTIAVQEVPRGTADAVKAAAEHIDPSAPVIVLNGDHPLISADVLRGLAETHEREGAAATIATATLDDPTGYGRVIRGKDGTVSHIVEHRDALDHELAVDEINTSVYCFRRDLLGPALRRLLPDNSQGEYYLTDVVTVLTSAGYSVGASVMPDPVEAQGVNDRAQLAFAEAELRGRTNRRWLLAGVTMLDPAQTYVDVTVDLGRDVTLFPGTILQGRTVVAAGSEIGPDTRLVDCVVGPGAVVEHTVAHDAEIGEGARVGPYAVLPPGSLVPAWTVTGPFYTGPT